MDEIPLIYSIGENSNPFLRGRELNSMEINSTVPLQTCTFEGNHTHHTQEFHEIVTSNNK